MSERLSGTVTHRMIEVETVERDGSISRAPSVLFEGVKGTNFAIQIKELYLLGDDLYQAIDKVVEAVESDGTRFGLPDKIKDELEVKIAEATKKRWQFWK